MKNNAVIKYNQYYDRLKRIEMHYQLCQDAELKQMLYDEIIYLKYKLKQLEEEISKQRDYNDDYTIAIQLWERICANG